jgi:hypothetical protein
MPSEFVFNSLRVFGLPVHFVNCVTQEEQRTQNENCNPDYVDQGITLFQIPFNAPRFRHDWTPAFWASIRQSADLVPAIKTFD